MTGEDDLQGSGPGERATTGRRRPPLLVFARYARKHWKLIALSTVALTVGAVFFSLGQTPIYRASALVQIDPSTAKPLGDSVSPTVQLGVSSYYDNLTFYETQYKIIQSRRVAESTVRSLGLERDAGFMGRLRPGETGAARPADIATAAKILMAHTEVKPIKGSRLVTVTYEDPDPARAARVLNALVNTYVEGNIDNAVTSTANASDWLGGQLGKLKDDLEQSEMALHDYKQTNNILSVSMDDQSNMLRGEMQQLNTALTTVQTTQQEVAARKSELDKIDAKDPAELPARELLQSGLLQQLREAYISATSDRDALLAAGRGANHPEVTAATARVDSARAALLAEVRNIKGSVTKDLAALQRQAAGLRKLFDAAKTRALDLNLREIQYNRLLRNKDNTEKLYSLVLERSKESDLTRMMRFNNISVVDDARPPSGPVRPIIPLNIALGFALGLGLGIGTAAARELLDRSIKTPDDLEEELGLPFLGLLPLSSDANAQKPSYARRRRRGQVPGGESPPELVVHDAPASSIAEAARAVRTNVMFMSPDRPYRKLLVTSASPYEGKTTIACSIAITMAQTGERVLLIDCDLRKPRVHRIFQRDNAVGVSSAILNPSVLDGAELATDVPNLSVLPAGPSVPNPAELLQSASFKRLLESLAARYDRVVIDSPPVAPVTDAAVLSTLVDGTLLVVRAFKTTREVARQALRALRDVGHPPFGVVLNGVDLRSAEYQYKGDYYFYYYRHEGYGSTTDRPD